MTKLFAWFGKRNKAVAAWVGANLTWCQLIAAQDGGFAKITAVEWVALAIANATALGVYTATNTPSGSVVTRNVPQAVGANVGGSHTLSAPLAPEDHAG